MHTLELKELLQGEAGVMSQICELSAMTTHDTRSVQVFMDLGGAARLTPHGHPNMPSLNPDPGVGIIDIATGFDGNPLGEVNIAIADTAYRYAIECQVESPEIVAEVSDGVNPMQILSPAIDRPSPDEVWASFVTVRPLDPATNPFTKIRIYFRQDWGAQPVPTDTFWRLFRITVWQIT